MKASEITFNSPDHRWIVEMMEELQSLWRVSEEAIGVNRANYKSPTFIATLLPDLVKDSFGGFSFKLLREQWMKANLAIANGERKDFQTLEWAMVRDAIRQAPYPVDESKLIAGPMTESEKEAAALKAKWDAMTPQERILAKIDQIANTPKDYLHSVLAGADKDVFHYMASKLTAEENEEHQEVSWGRWRGITESRWQVSIGDFTDNPDRWNQSHDHLVKKLNVRAPNEIQNIRPFMRGILREEICKIYFRIDR